MKKAILVLLVSLLCVGNSFALVSGPLVDSYWDLDATAVSAENLVGDSTVFRSFSYDANTTSYVSATGAVVDQGNADLTALKEPFFLGGSNNPLIDTSGNIYEVTIAWRDLVGQVTSSTATNIHTDYYSGTFKFYLDEDNDAAFFTPSSGAEDDTGFENGTHFATVEVIAGYNDLNYTNGVFTGGSYNLTGKFAPNSEFADNFWFEYGTDDDLKEKYVQFEFLFASTNGDNDPDEIWFDSTGGTYSYLDNGQNNDFTYAQKIQSAHNSSALLFVVPEPSTFLLLGFGLVGLGFVARRRKS